MIYKTRLVVTSAGIEVWTRRNSRDRYQLLVTTCSSWTSFIECGDLDTKHIFVTTQTLVNEGDER